MPIYEYKCSDCKKIFEERQRITDDNLDECKFCKSSNIEKIISKSSFRLKGGGWAEDGYDKDDSFDISGQGKV